MKTKCGLISLLFVACAADAQGPIEGTVFVGADSAPSAFNALSAGVGVQGYAWKGLGLGADIAFIGRTDYLDEGIGLFSVGPSWTFNRAGKLAPFVNGGYGLAFRSGVLNLGYVGGGATYWFHRRAGLRLELRNYFTSSERFDTSLRIGVSFR